MTAYEGRRTSLKCPDCGAILLTDGVLVWCSRVKPLSGRSCDYGVVREVRREEAEAAQEWSRRKGA